MPKNFLSLTVSTLLFAQLPFQAMANDQLSCQGLFQWPVNKSVYHQENLKLKEDHNWREEDSFEIISSGRDHDRIEIYREFCRRLYKPGGVLDLLGIPRTKQIIHFMTGQDLNAVAKAGVGGFPVAHPLDGASVVKAYQDRSSLIYEVVYPGEKFQYAFYRDDNPLQEQLSILLHVIGHNHFANSGFMNGYRAAHGPFESIALDKTLSHLYETENKQDVINYYFQLQSAKVLQDYATGFYQTVADLAPKPNTGKKSGNSFDATKAPTANVFQDLVANIPDTAPHYKKEIGQRLVNMTSFQSALTQTQIMNEGWATFMQELLMKYMGDFDTPEYWIQASKLMNAGKRVQLSDPYWLGVNGWRRLYEKFRARPEVRAMKSDADRDRAFIKIANDEFLQAKNDAAFLTEALDATWVARYNLAITDQVPKEEPVDQSKLPPPPKTEEPIAPWKIKSRNAQTIIRSIIEEHFDVKYKYRARIERISQSRRGSGEIELNVGGEIGHAFPIEPTNVAAALYNFSKIADKPVSLEATLLDISPQQIWNNQSHPGRQWGPPPPPQEPTVSRYRLVAAPNGAFSAYRITDIKTKEEVLEPQMTAKLAAYLDSYLVDFNLSSDKDMREMLEHNPRMVKMRMEMVQDVIDNASSHASGTFIDQVPQAAKAMQEFETYFGSRMANILNPNSKYGNMIHNNGGKVFVKALPSIPMIQFDFKYLQEHLPSHEKQLLMQTIAQDPAAFKSQISHLTFAKNKTKNFGSVHPINGGGEGDYFWGPDQNGGKGQGDGDEPGQSKPGEDPNDPTWVELPMDKYAKWLGEQVELPILNPKQGSVSDTRRVLKGRLNRKSGQTLETETLMNIIKKGMAERANQGVADPGADVDEMLKAGFDVMNPKKDWVVKKNVDRPEPDRNIVITYVLDGSGSNQPNFAAFKQLVFDLNVLLKQNYANVEVRFVVFDTNAHEVKEKDFFKIELWGGTDYSSGLKLTHQIFEKDYPHDEWDRYTILLGDLEDFGKFKDKTGPVFHKLLDDTEFIGVVKAGSAPADWYDIINEVKALANQREDVGYVDLGPSPVYNIEHIRTLLKNKKK